MSTYSESLGNHLTFCALTPFPAKLKTLILTEKKVLCMRSASRGNTAQHASYYKVH